MANNFTTNVGAGGNTFASDDVAGVHYPYTKLVFGPDDTATIVTASVGLPVQLITLAAPLNVTGGGVEASALRVTIASDSTGVLSVDDNGGSLTVDGTVAFSNTTIAVTNAGTFAVQAAQSGTWVLGANSGVDIGDVDVTSVVPGFAASSLGKRVDDPATTSDVGVALLAKRTGTPANFSGADGDYEPLQISAGRLHTSTLASGSQSHDAVDSGAPVKIGGFASSTAPAAVSGSGDRVNAWYDLNGRAVVLIESSLPAGTNNIGDVDVLTVPADPFGANADAASATGSISAKLRFIASTGIPITGTVTVGSHAVTNAGTFAVQQTTSTSGGTQQSSQLSTAAVISTAVKASAGQVYGVHCFNNGANEVFLRLYNQTGAPGSGDTANIVYRAMIPGNAAGAGFVVNIPPGMEFSTGIGVRVTGAVADNDTTALAANEVMVNILYK